MKTPEQFHAEELAYYLNKLGLPAQTPEQISQEDFVELHFHTEYSALDGATRIADIAEVVLEHGQKAVAVSDHGTMSAIFDVYKQCKKKGIKLIPGMESYIVDDANKAHVRRRRKKVEKTEIEDEAQLKKEIAEEIDNTDSGSCTAVESQEAGTDEPEVKTITSPDWESHVVLLPKNEIGYRNLLKLHFEGYLHKRVNTFGRVIPRIDLSLLEKYKEGVIVLTACLGGQINQALIRGADELAEQILLRYKNSFPDFYVEVQPIAMLPRDDAFEYKKAIVEQTESLQIQINHKIVDLALKHNVPIVVTTDAHYARKEDRDTHALLLATQSKKDIADPRCFYFPALYMMDAQSLAKQFPISWIKNTKKIADMCEDSKYLDFGKNYKIPTFPVPTDDARFSSWKQQVLASQPH